MSRCPIIQSDRNRCCGIAVLILCTAMLAFPGVSFAKGNARIADGSCRMDNQAYLLSFRVDGAFTPELDRAVQSGIPTTFTYYFNIYRRVGGLFDDKVSVFQVRRTIHFDNIHQTYTILMGEKGTTVVVPTLAEAQEKMTAFKDLPIAVVSALPGSEGYYVKVKAQMEKVEIPFPIDLEFLFFFSSLWDFQTTWTRIEVKPASPPSSLTPVPPLTPDTTKKSGGRP